MKTETQEERASEVPEAEVGPARKAVKKSGNRVGYHYIIIKSYKESQKNDVVKCLYIKSLTRFGFCVIKEGSYGDTKDKNGRDIIDRLKWQQQLHEELQDKLPMPRLLGHFEEKGNYYLVIEHIKGKALQKVCAQNRKELRQSVINGGRLGLKFVDYLIQMAGILETLHSNQVVHRDATPNNYMITPGGKVALIDMEMCYSLKKQYPLPAFQLGTYGYMSPQQELTQTPTTAEDIFALGAITLQIWSGVSPGKMTGEASEALAQKIMFFINDKKVADMVMQCMSSKDDERPSADQVKQVLEQYKTDLKEKIPRPAYLPRLYAKEDMLASIQKAITTLASPLMADETKGWFADDMSPAPAEDKHKLRKRWYASYNRGVSGIIYMLAQANGAGLDTTVTRPYIQKALDLIREKYINRIEKAKTGLHFGSDGVAATLATAIHQGLINPTTEYLNWIGELLEKENTGPDMMKGAPGQGMAVMISSPFLGTQMVKERLHNLIQLLIQKQDLDGSWEYGFYKQKFTRRKKKRVTRGFNEGISGAIYFLLEYGYRYQDIASREAAARGLQWLIKKAKHKKGNVHWLSASNKELSYGWSDGIAGIALTFIKAYQHTNLPVYKQYAVKALRGISGNITDSNLSQRSGLSGLGEVYLEAYTVFNEEEWLERAGWIAQVIMHLKKQHPKHGTYWLVEHERQPVANFMAGNSGVMHFLLRYCYPQRIALPMMEKQLYTSFDVFNKPDKSVSTYEPAPTA